MKPEMVQSLGSIVTACFFGTWVVLGIAGFILFYCRREATFKRKWFPRYIVLVGILFVFFAGALSVASPGPQGGLGMLVVIIPAVCLISYMNIKLTNFCDNCGATLTNMSWFTSMKYCSKCGAELDAKTTYDDRLE